MEQANRVEGTRGSVLVVDDVDIMRTTCKRTLEKEGYEVIDSASGQEALKRLPSDGVDVAVLDIRMPGISGVDLLRKIKTDWPETEVIMMTAYSDADMAEESLNLGASALLTKPFEDIDVLRKTVRKSMARVKLRRGQEHEDGPCFEDILKGSGLVNEHELERARSKAEKDGIILRQALASLEILSQEDQDWAVANYLDIPYVRLNSKMLDPDLIKNFPADLARAYTCLPLFRNRDELHLVIANPFDRQASEAIAYNLEAVPVLSMGNEAEIKQLITRFYGPSQEAGLEEIIKKLADDRADGKTRLIKDLFQKAEFEEVSDISISAEGDGRFAIRLEGRIKTGENN